MEQNEVCVTSPIHYRGWVDQKSAIAMFGALAQETRFAAFQLLVNEGSGLPSGEIAERLSVPQNTLSSHIAVLERAGLVSSERQGRSIIYRAEPAAADALARFFGAD